MNDKILGVFAIVIIIGGLLIADLYGGEINPAIIRLADISVGGILGNMIGVHVRFSNQNPKG